ncbi:MAG: MarR family transcriptional regulator [Solirubrobacterales bacterium]|nr:MarR family transcriptional regulator [Solirubrobacterales bacterium]
MPDPLAFDPIDEAARQWRKHWGAATAPPMAAVTSIMRVHQILLARLDEILKPHDLRFPRYEALMLLFYSRTGSLPLGKMGVRLQVHPTSVTSLIDRLERTGYVTRSPHPTDRRTTLATITDQGRAVAEQATRELNAIGFGTAPLQRPELETLAETLRIVRLDAADYHED